MSGGGSLEWQWEGTTSVRGGGNAGNNGAAPGHAMVMQFRNASRRQRVWGGGAGRWVPGTGIKGKRL